MSEPVIPGTAASAAPTNPISELTIVVAGLVTSALALGGVYWLAWTSEDFYIMGWYAMYVLPIGAILVGVVAGSGYGLMSWFQGRKLGGGILVMVVVLLVAAFAGAQYLEFAALQLHFENGEPVPFFEYYDATTRSMAFESSRSSSPSSPLGLLGYLFRLLDLVGFAAGGMVIPGVLLTKPYCDECRVYRRTRNLGLLPAGIPKRKIKKKDTEGQAQYEQELQQALEAGLARAQGVVEATANADPAPLRQALVDHAPDRKSIGKQIFRIEVDLEACPRCQRGHVVTKLLKGLGENQQTETLARTPVEMAFVQQLA